MAVAHPILTCKHCSAVLLNVDHIGGTVGALDRALTHHGSAACIESSSSQQGRALRELLHRLERGAATVAALAPCVHWPDDEPPLLFCVRWPALRDLAFALLNTGLAAATAAIDAPSKDGLTALHLAALNNDAELCAALCAAGADPTRQSQDNTAAQLPGGRTALHCCRGVDTARVLAAAGPTALIMSDWQGSLPAQVAWLHRSNRLAAHLAAAALQHAEEVARRGVRGGHDGGALLDSDDAAELEQMRRCAAAMAEDGGEAPCASDGEVQTHAAFVRVDVKERNRLRLCIDGRPRLRTPHVLRALLSRGECEALAHQVARAAARDGWQQKRHAHYATTDFALWRAPAAAAWVRERVARHVLPAIARLYDIAPSRLALRESFVVRYEPQLQPSLALHKDATLLSCNVLLSHHEGFDGGGTAFAEPVRAEHWALGAPPDAALQRCGEGGDEAPSAVLSGSQGDCVLHCGQLLHGGHPVSRGVRLVLVCFIDELYEP